MIKCECGVEKYSPKEARALLQISAVSLNNWREKGWIEPSDKMGTWHIYSKNSLLELKRELDRRNHTGVEYDTR